jgi:selenide,water dikinase
MDCSVIPLKYQGLSMISTTDFFYPSVDDPYMQGKIGCANVLSDLYAMGIVECNTMLMLLAASNEMEKNERQICTRLIIEGFTDLAKEAGVVVTGGQTVLNPWPIIGGVATSICQKEDFILQENALPGDVLVLTKPLGTQVASNVSQWRYKETSWNRVKDFLTEEEAERAYQVAMSSMSRLNLTAAKLMHKYEAHGATDITGFGILGHSRNLAKNQKAAIQFEIHTLPIIKHMKEVDDHVKSYNLLKGLSAETSGGLLICLAEDKAEYFCRELEAIDHQPCWIIGRVLPSNESRINNDCHIVENVKVIDV